MRAKVALLGCLAIVGGEPLSCGELLRVVDEEVAAARPVTVRGTPNLPSGAHEFLPEFVPLARSAFPLRVEATASANGTDLPTLARAAAAVLDAQLSAHGAVLFRGLPLSTPEDFSHFGELLFGEQLGWARVVLGGGGTERSTLADGVRTASDEPATHTIEPHQDMAHNPTYPAKIAFFMLRGPPADAGGETVLVDMRRVTAAMREAGLIELFERHGGVKYEKRLWSAERVETSFSWQKRYFSSEKGVVDAALAEMARGGAALSWRWTEDETLEYENTLPATRLHPRTAEEVWFNGIHTNHRDYFDLAPHIDTSLGSPYDTRFADGTAIDDDLLAQIRAAWWDNSVACTLRDGDLVVVDNLLVGHGRMGWRPDIERKMLLSHFD